MKILRNQGFPIWPGELNTLPSLAFGDHYRETVRKMSLSTGQWARVLVILVKVQERCVHIWLSSCSVVICVKWELKNNDALGFSTHFWPLALPCSKFNPGQLMCLTASTNWKVLFYLLLHPLFMVKLLMTALPKGSQLVIYWGHFQEVRFPHFSSSALGKDDYYGVRGCVQMSTAPAAGVTHWCMSGVEQTIV